MTALTAMPVYYWEITEDHIHQPEEETAVGVSGGEDDYRGVNRARFELYDDDDILYFVGYIYGEYDGFEPKDDYGIDFGVTGVKIEGEWL